MLTSNDSASPRIDSLRFRRLRIRVVLLGLFIILAFAGSSVYDAWRSHRHSLVATERELGNVANALAEQTAWTFQAVDLLLGDTARWYQNESGRIAPERLDEILANRAAGVRQVRLVTIVDAQGIQRHRSRGSSPPHLDVSDRSYFIAQRDGTVAGLYISEPLVTRSENREGIVVSRRLDDGKGGFAGVVTAIVDLQELEQFYGAVNLGRGSAIHLLRDSGLLLVRNPPIQDAVGRTFTQLRAAPTAPAPKIVNAIDGSQAFVAVARVRDMPLLLAVTRDVAVALLPWRDEATRFGVRAGVLTLLGVLTVAVLVRQLRKVEAGQQALRESEERYALAMEGANEGHWDWDVKRDRLFLSPKMKTLAGQSADSEIETRAEWMARIVIHPDDRPRFDAALEDHFQGRTQAYECEYRVRQPDGEWRWVVARGRCLRDAAGAPFRFVGSAIDVTAQKQAQSEKESLQGQLRQSQKMEALGTLAGGIAHDFNNILGAILGYGELAQQHSTDGSALRRYVDNVMHAAGRAKALVDRILGFSRSGLGEHVPVHVQSVVEETLELLSASLPARITLAKRLEAGDAAVMGDPTHLHQVAMNLCTNALHAMEAGGAMTVTLERVELSAPRSLSRGSLSPGPYVCLVVSDTGPGIPAAVLERVFDPFFTTRRVSGGTGLGLSLVHGIVADLGGAIDVVTKEGEGTTLSIWLPVAGEVSRVAGDAADTVPRGAGQTVMIVDDEPQLVALTEETLAELGYEPVGFGFASAAISAIQAAPGRFDLVLTDEAMPGLTGTELAGQLRRLQPDLPIILMSGHGGSALARQAAEIGVNEVLRKPLQRRDLAEAVARVLAAAS
jgi:PAS domain S-box-containing protein